MNKTIQTITLAVLLGGVSSAGAETLDIRSYYPSPTGSYEQLRFMPRSAIGTSSCDLGVVFFNTADDQLYMCSAEDADGEWMPISGTGGGVWSRTGDVIHPNTDILTDGTYTVAIGTDTPDPNADLHVYNGNMLLGGGSDDSAMIDLGGSNGNIFRWLINESPAGSWLRLSNDPNSGTYTRMMIIDGDNRGIRIGDSAAFANVTHPLEINGPASATSSPRVPDLLIQGDNARLTIETELDAGFGSSATLRIVPGSSNGSTINPNKNFEISGLHNKMHWTNLADNGSQINRFLVMDPTNGNVAFGNDWDPTARLTVRSETTATGALNVMDSNSNSLLFLNNNAQMGIGTDAPTIDLQIYSVDAKIIVENDPQTTALGYPDNAAFHVRVPDGNTDFRINATNDLLQFQSMNKGACTAGPPPNCTVFKTGLVMDASGNFSIGKTRPAAGIEMDVAGDIEYTGSLQDISDARLKKNIEPLAFGMDTVNRLRPVTFEHRVDEFPDMKLETGPAAGFIAQDVEDVIPIAVTRGDDDFYRLSSVEIIPYLVKAIQDIHADFENQWAELMVENENLKHMIAELETGLQQP